MPPGRCLLLLLGLTGCSSLGAAPRPATLGPADRPPVDIATSTPEAEGLRRDDLARLTAWVRDNPAPIFSLLISRHGRLVYELYTSSIERDDAHYMMSVTKSVLSALVGIAIDRGLIPGPDAVVADLLPRHLFASNADVDRFRTLTLGQVMGMAALDAPDPPRTHDPAAVARQQRFWLAPNRVADALQRPRLGAPFQYNDSTPALAAGALQYAAGQSALDFAEQALFAPLGFRNHEWMHQDPAGLDNGGYGLRLRPVDMQKLGLLYLAHGAWDGRQLLSRAWVDRSFEPWNRSRPGLARPDYGWFWWALDYGHGWTAHVADGWKGQRIAVFPEQDVVVTMTGCIEDGSEYDVFTRILTGFVIPSAQAPAQPPGPPADLTALADEVRRGPSRMPPDIEPRMVPSARPLQQRRPFRAR